MLLRLATLATVLAAAAPVLAQDRGAADAAGTVIDAERIEGISDLEVSATGAAEIRRGETSIFGESLRYNRELGTAEAEGGVRLQSGVDRFVDRQPATVTSETSTTRAQRRGVALRCGKDVMGMGAEVTRPRRRGNRTRGV